MVDNAPISAQNKGQNRESGVPDYAVTKPKRYLEAGTSSWLEPNLFGCSFCGAVVAYDLIPTHTKWHQDIAGLLALEAIR